MFKPTYRLTINSTTIDASRAPATSTVVALTVTVDMDAPADQLTLVLGRVDGVGVAQGDDLALELGYGDNLTQVWSGSAAVVEPGVTEVRVVGLTVMTQLLALRVDQTYEDKTAGQIASDLTKQAGISTGTVEGGITFPFYVVDSRRNAYQHLRDLAEKCGFDLYVTSEGELTFAKFAKTSPDHTFVYGSDIITLEVRQQSAKVEQVVAVGESPASSEGSQAASWLAKSFAKFKGTAGAGRAALILEDVSVRTRQAAQTFAQAKLDRLKKQTVTGRLQTLGRPGVKLGDAIRIQDMPEGRMDGIFQVRSVTHRLSKAGGFLTTIGFWGLGS
jgi:phage protein D